MEGQHNRQLLSLCAACVPAVCGYGFESAGCRGGRRWGTNSVCGGMRTRICDEIKQLAQRHHREAALLICVVPYKSQQQNSKQSNVENVRGARAAADRRSVAGIQYPERNIPNLQNRAT